MTLIRQRKNVAYRTAQKNELLCKLIAHNIVVVIHEMHELGIKPDFSTNTCFESQGIFEP